MPLTKQDLKQIQEMIDKKTLSPQEYDNIKELINLTLEERLNLEPSQTLDDKLKHLPSKEEFFNQSDKLMKELKTIHEEIIVISDLTRRVNNHQTVLEKVGKRLNIAVSA